MLIFAADPAAARRFFGARCGPAFRVAAADDFAARVELRVGGFIFVGGFFAGDFVMEDMFGASCINLCGFEGRVFTAFDRAFAIVVAREESFGIAIAYVAEFQAVAAAFDERGS